MVSIVFLISFRYLCTRLKVGGAERGGRHTELNTGITEQEYWSKRVTNKWTLMPKLEGPKCRMVDSGGGASIPRLTQPSIPEG